MLEPGTRLGAYEIESLIGSGGMGEVYRARDPRLQRDVAIKVISPHLASQPAAIEQFGREARAVAKLTHPNVLAVFEFDTDGDISFAVTELLEGETLRSRLRHGALPWRKAVAIAIEIAEGLAAAHAKGILHRDLKPENVFITSSGMVKILDFGLARPRPVRSTVDDDSTPTERYEHGREVVRGTITYMAPELLRGQDADAPADLFALGTTLYEMLTGSALFGRPTAVDTMSAILREEAPPLTVVAGDPPAALDRIIQRAVTKNPLERFQSAGDFAFALRALSESKEASEPRATTRRSPLPLLLTVGLIVLGVGSAGLFLTRSAAGTAESSPIGSIAVLPFINATNERSNDYLSDGLTETLIQTLSRLPHLGVVSRSSSFRYKGANLQPRRIGKELDVEALLTGRLSHAADRLVVSVELIDAANDRHLWGEQFTAEKESVFALQQTIARAITEQLRLQLSRRDEQELSKRHTESNEAFQHYLLGRYEWNKRTPEAFVAAIDHFERAIAIDSRYALAYAGLADSFTLQAVYNVRSPREALPEARAAATQALALDASLAEAHTALAYFKMNYESDLAGAESSFRQAIRLNPNYATAHQWLSRCLVTMKRFPEAISEIRKAETLDPLSLVIIAEAGGVYADAGETEQAVGYCRRALQIDPRFALARYVLAGAHLRRGEFSQAALEAQQAWSLGDDPRSLVRVGMARLAGGQREEAAKVLGELEVLSASRFIPAISVAGLALALERKEEAVRWVERSYEQVPPGQLVRALEESTFDTIRGDERFAAVLGRARRDKSEL